VLPAASRDETEQDEPISGTQTQTIMPDPRSGSRRRPTEAEHEPGTTARLYIVYSHVPDRSRG